MQLARFAFVLLTASLLALPLRAQSYDEADNANASVLRQAAMLDHADNELRQWLGSNAESIGLEPVQVAQVDDLLNGWRTYTLKECGLIGTMTGGNAASKATYTSICQERRYVARIKVVDEATSCLSKALAKSESDSGYASTCLELLTPLKMDADFDG
jgi:hypothetical protein